MNLLRSVGNACPGAEQKDEFDVFGNHIATKMRRLSSSVDQETIEIIFHHSRSYILILNKISRKNLINLVGIKTEHWGKLKKLNIKNSFLL